MEIPRFEFLYIQIVVIFELFVAYVVIFESLFLLFYVLVDVPFGFCASGRGRRIASLRPLVPVAHIG